MFEAFVDSIIPLNLTICLFGVLNVLLEPSKWTRKTKNQQISVSHALTTLPVGQVTLSPRCGGSGPEASEILLKFIKNVIVINVENLASSRAT